MMQVKINYREDTTTVPTIDTAILARATAEDLRVLLYLCASHTTLSADSEEALYESVGHAVGCSGMSVAASVAFWRGTGILELTRERALRKKPAPSAVTTPPPAPPPSDESSRSRVSIRRAPDQLPTYTATDLADLMEKRLDIKENIDECNRIWRNLLNLQEINTILGLSEYLGLDWDYILSLLARGVEEMDRLGMKHSMRYIEKQAIRLYDEGIHTLSALQEKFRSLDALHTAEGRLRKLFGMGERAMTPSETKLFSTWLYDFKFDFEIIEIAYNIAVDIKGNPDKRYINSILANWNRDELRTPAAIQAAMADFRAEQERKRTRTPAKKATAPAESGGSFDTDNFFDAAVRRSLGEDAPT